MSDGSDTGVDYAPSYSNSNTVTPVQTANQSTPEHTPNSSPSHESGGMTHCSDGGLIDIGGIVDLGGLIGGPGSLIDLDLGQNDGHTAAILDLTIGHDDGLTIDADALAGSDIFGSCGLLDGLLADCSVLS